MIMNIHRLGYTLAVLLLALAWPAEAGDGRCTTDEEKRKEAMP